MEGVRTCTVYVFLKSEFEVAVDYSTSTRALFSLQNFSRFPVTSNLAAHA